MRMTSVGLDASYGDLNIGGQVVSTLHQRPYKTTHINTVRAQRRAHAGKSTKSYITTSRKRMHQMRNIGNIIPLEKGHMRLSPQARKTMNIILSHPGLTKKQQAKCVNALAGVLTQRKITRDGSILEVATTVTGSVSSSRSPRTLPPQSEDQNALQAPAAGLPIPDNAPQQSIQPLSQLADDTPDEIMGEPRVSDTPLLGKPGPSQPPLGPRTVSRHGTEVFYGLVTPGNSPTKAPRDKPISTVVEQDIEMDETFVNDHDPPPTSSPGDKLDSLAPQAEPQFDVMSEQNSEIAELRREKAALLEKEEYVLRKLSRNGQGTVSDIETVVNRSIRQREELHAENQKLQAVIERLKSGIADLQGKIKYIQDKLGRTEGERIEMAQSRRRWIARVWTLVGRVPGELRKKDAEIESMREKLAGMHARLAQEQLQLRERQARLDEERVKRMDAEAELDDSRRAHAQEIKDRDLAGRRLRDQLKQMVNNIDSGAMSF